MVFLAPDRNAHKWPMDDAAGNVLAFPIANGNNAEKNAE